MDGFKEWLKKCSTDELDTLIDKIEDEKYNREHQGDDLIKKDAVELIKQIKPIFDEPLSVEAPVFCNVRNFLIGENYINCYTTFASEQIAAEKLYSKYKELKEIKQKIENLAKKYDKSSYDIIHLMESWIKE